LIEEFRWLSQQVRLGPDRATDAMHHRTEDHARIAVPGFHDALKDRGEDCASVVVESAAKDIDGTGFSYRQPFLLPRDADAGSVEYMLESNAPWLAGRQLREPEVERL